MNPQIGRAYRTESELEWVFHRAGVQPVRPAFAYENLIANHELLPFVWDGPSDFLIGRHIIGALYGRRWSAFVKAIIQHSFRHDVEHWLGDESGTTRDLSNATFRAGLLADGFPLGAKLAFQMVDRFSALRAAPWRWGFGWPVKHT